MLLCQLVSLHISYSRKRCIFVTENWTGPLSFFEGCDNFLLFTYCWWSDLCSRSLRTLRTTLCTTLSTRSFPCMDHAYFGSIRISICILFGFSQGGRYYEVKFHRKNIVGALSFTDNMRVLDTTDAAWKVSVFVVFLVHIFPHSDRIWSTSPYSVQMRENTGQRNSKYGHFSCSDGFFFRQVLPQNMILILLWHRKTLIRRDFILKPTERL